MFLIHFMSRQPRLFLCKMFLTLSCVWIYGHLIRYNCLQTFLNSLWHLLINMLETILQHFAPYCTDFSHPWCEKSCSNKFQRVLSWIKVWWVWRLSGYSELIVILKKKLRCFNLCHIAHYPAGNSHQETSH